VLAASTISMIRLVLAIIGGVGFLCSVSAMAQAVGIKTPDQRWRRRDVAPTTDEVLANLADPTD
jgi:hypothetical protein